MKQYPRDPGSCTWNVDEAAQIQYEKENPQGQQEQEEQEQQGQQAQDEQDEQEQAEAEGLRRSQRLRVQRNQSDQHSV